MTLRTIAAAIGTLRPEDVLLGFALACVGAGIVGGLVWMFDRANRRKAEDWMAEGGMRR